MPSLIIINIALKPSTTIRKRNGEIGSPLHNPLSKLNSLVGLPFTNREVIAEPTYLKIRLHHYTWKLLFLITLSRYFQPT